MALSISSAHARRLAFVIVSAALVACGPTDTGPDIRGTGLRAAPLDARQRAAVYDAALHQAFDVDSALVLLIDPAVLPRNGTFDRGATVGDDVMHALQGRGSVRGSCEIQTWDDRRAPRCAASGPGYVVRFSDVYQMQGDSVRLFLAAQRFQTTAGLGPAGRFAFESGFEVVHTGNTWRVAREGRRIAK